MEIQSSGAMGEIVKRTLVGPAIDANRNRRKPIAKVWRKMKSRHPYINEATLQTTFTSCLRDYTIMKENMTAFLQEDSVKACLAAQPQPSRGLTRLNAVEAFWFPSSMILRPGTPPVPQSLAQVRPYDLLLNRRFGLMLDLAKYYILRRSAHIHAFE